VNRLKEGGIQIDPAWKERVSKHYGLSIGEWKARRKKVGVYCLRVIHV
jgi:hypothetical protein